MKSNHIRKNVINKDKENMGGANFPIFFVFAYVIVKIYIGLH